MNQDFMFNKYTTVSVVIKVDKQYMIIPGTLFGERRNHFSSDLNCFMVCL